LKVGEYWQENVEASNHQSLYWKVEGVNGRHDIPPKRCHQHP
jgi:hypothetical protein